MSGRSRWLLLLVVAVLLVLGYAALDRFVLSRRATAPVNASAASVAPEQSIAVLPFVDMSEKKDVSWAILGGRLTTDRQYAAAHEALRRSLEIQPDLNYALYDLGMLEMLEGNAAQALSTFHRIDDGVYGLSGVAMAQHSLGRSGESDQAVDALIAKFPRGADYQIAQACAWLGEKDKAFHWLERAYQSHDGGMAQIKDDLALASLRDDDRFTEMLRKLKLPE